MKSKILLLGVSCLMVAALVLGSCAPAEKPAPTPTPEEGKVKVTLTKLDGTKLEKWKEKPKYGGVFTGALWQSVAGFDDVITAGSANTWINRQTSDELLTGDWTRGPVGTGEAEWQMQGYFDQALVTGALAESWEIIEPDTIIFHIRKGVHWQDKPPVNGREFTADDVVSNIKRAYIDVHSRFYYEATGMYFVSVEKTDKWTVVVKAKPEGLGTLFKTVAAYLTMVPPEVIEKYGDNTKWENVVGTGPFTLEDYVHGSSATLKRNPNYWRKDPFFPENQLPYLDEVRWLVIPDKSTRIAALRTAKVDWMINVGWEDAASLMKTNPELKSYKFMEAAHFNIIYFNHTKPELPFSDIRVRRALAMAMDNEAIKRDFYGGNAELLSAPVAPYPEYLPYYTPLEEQSEIVQKCYGYYPEEAKKLLAEAGYPDGFKTKIVCLATQADLLSIVKDYWSEIGVDLELQVKERAAWTALQRGLSFDELHCGVMSTVAPMVAYFLVRYQNGGFEDPRLWEAGKKIEANDVVNQAAAYKALKEIVPYYCDQVTIIETPTPNLWILWYPWVMGYGGETTVGRGNRFNFPTLIWIDQELKAKK